MHDDLAFLRLGDRSTDARTPNRPPLALTCDLSAVAAQELHFEPLSQRRLHVRRARSTPSRRARRRAFAGSRRCSCSGPSFTLAAVTLHALRPARFSSSFAICAVLSRRLPAFTSTESALPHSSSTAGHAFTVTLFTVPYCSTRERILLAAIPGRNNCASTSSSTIAPRAALRFGRLSPPAQLRSLASLRVFGPGGA